MPSSRDSTCSEKLWKETNADLGALKSIVVSHFQSPCLKQDELEPGSFARIFLYALQSGMQIIARVVLPVRDTSKTEAEVATMDYLRARTTIPVPKVYLFCSSAKNPVGAEWILMEYVSGAKMSDCFEDLTLANKLRTAEDLARIMHSLFRITAPCCGLFYWATPRETNNPGFLAYSRVPRPLSIAMPVFQTHSSPYSPAREATPGRRSHPTSFKASEPTQDV